MKNHLSNPFKLLVIISLTILIYSACKKSDDPVTTSSVVATNDALRIGRSWATLKGVINAANITTIVSFEYDTTTSYAYTIEANPDTVTGSAATSVTAELTGLLKNTTYHFRVKAIKPNETLYGLDYSFTTSDSTGIELNYNENLTYGSLDDNDGNTYKTIEIGDQTWMAENLKTTKYSDGTPIPFVTDPLKWTALSTPGYGWYNYDSVQYGGLYNWYVVNTGNICPSGWHIPSDDEWTILTSYLGGTDLAGSSMKETGTVHWQSSNTGVTNESGFTGIAGGYLNYSGAFNSIKKYGYWWSSTEVSTTDAYYRSLYYGYSNIDKSSSNKRSGLSIRCIKD